MPKDMAFERSNSAVSALVGKWEEKLKKRGKSAALFSVAIPLAACNADGEVAVDSEDLAGLGTGSIGSGQGGSSSNTIGGTTNGTTNTNTLTPGDVNVNVDVNVDAGGDDDEGLFLLLQGMLTSINTLIANQNTALGEQNAALEDSAKALQELLDYVNGGEDGEGGLLDQLADIQGELDLIKQALTTNLEDLVEQVEFIAGDIDVMRQNDKAFFDDLLDQIATLNRILDEETMIIRGAVANGEGAADDGDLFILTADSDFSPLYDGSANDDVYWARLVEVYAGYSPGTYAIPTSIPPQIEGPFVASSLSGDDFLDGKGGNDTLYVFTNMLTGVFSGDSPIIENIEVIKVTAELFDGEVEGIISWTPPNQVTAGSSTAPEPCTDPRFEITYQTSHYDFREVLGLQSLWSSWADAEIEPLVDSVTPAYTPILATELYIENVQNLVTLSMEYAGAGHEFYVFYADGALSATDTEQEINLVGWNGTKDGVHGALATIYVGDYDGIITDYAITADESEWNWVNLEDGTVAAGTGGAVKNITVSGLDETVLETGDLVDDDVPDADTQMMHLRITDMPTLESIDTTDYDSGVFIELWDGRDAGDSVPAADDTCYSGHSLDGKGVEISTGSGDDLIVGSVGKDTISGGEGADTIDGGPGLDTFIFAAGDTVMWTAGTATADGDDVFTFANGADVIRNFEDPGDSRIDPFFKSLSDKVVFDQSGTDDEFEGSDFGTLFGAGGSNATAIASFTDTNLGDGVGTVYAFMGTWSDADGTNAAKFVEGTQQTGPNADVDFMFVYVNGTQTEVLITDNTFYESVV